MSAKELVAIGIKRGWIHTAPAQTINTLVYLAYEKPMYEKYKEQGLTIQGNPRKNKKHPELAGLSRKEYHLKYQRLMRGKPLSS